MARIRTIKPEFFKHEDLFEAEIQTQLPLRVAFIGIWTICDREGRFKWRPRQIKTDVLPYDECDFSRVLDALATRGFVVKYASNGEYFGHVPSFHSHQIVNNRESDSILPDPYECEQMMIKNNDFDACTTRAPRESDIVCITLSGREGKGREGKGKEGDKPSCDSDEPQTKAPDKELMEIYNQNLGGQLPKAQMLTAKRKAAIKQRWFEILGSKTPNGKDRYTDLQTGLAWWNKFFLKVKTNPHWMGENDRGWKADFDWIINPSNFVKILEYNPAKV